jgi:ankyrin repeat protein
MHACFQGHASTVEYLLQLPSSLAPPNVNARDSTGRTPLIHACVRGHADIVAMLLRYRPSSTSSLSSSSSSSSAPHKRGSKSAAPKTPLLPVDAGAADAKGWTALMAACWMGHTACVRALLGDGSGDHTASDAVSAAAALNASSQVVASGSSSNAGTGSGSAAGSSSATGGRSATGTGSASGTCSGSATSSAALNARCAELHDRTALMMAAENGHAACLDLLLSAGMCDFVRSLAIAFVSASCPARIQLCSVHLVHILVFHIMSNQYF